MPKGESLYARLEVDFFTSASVQNMSSRARLGYLAWWLMALKERREILLPHQCVPSTVGVRTGIDIRAVREGLASGRVTPGSPLLILYDTGHVRVCGVRAKHANLSNWHDADDAELGGRLAQIQPANAGLVAYRSVTERNVAYTAPQTPPVQNTAQPPKDASGNPGQSNGTDPVKVWLKYRNEHFTQSDRRMIEELWEDHGDVAVHLAMTKAIAKKGNLGLVRKILADEKAQRGETFIFRKTD